MENPLQNKIAMVTGGGQGLGEQICLVLAEMGVKLVVTDIDADKIVRVAKILTDGGHTAIAVPLDVTQEQNVKDVLRIVKDKFGGLDFLINNAAIDFTKPVHELTVSEWTQEIQVNLTGAFIVSKYALEIMYAEQSGHIVNIASTAATRAWSEAAPYHASKWGLRGFSHALFTEARKFNVKVSVVIAGGMKTPFLLDRFPEIDQRTLQEPRQVADAVKFVLSQPEGTIIPEIMVLPLHETSWP